jgi:aminomethyltransferase
MDQPSPIAIRKTSLNDLHHARGARMVAFAGWEMPLEYSGITQEHLAVRTRGGLFDVSHMGEIEIAGKSAVAALQYVTSNDVSKLSVGQAHYTAITTPSGGVVDDGLVYRFGPSHFLMVVNAANTEKDYRWIVDQTQSVGDVAVVDSSARYALLALQGPVARQVLQPLTGIDLSLIKYYWFAHGEIAGVRGTVSRTGYTGEDGFEIFVPPASAARVWDAVLQVGADAGVVPVGLGARDTLRLEAAMRLYGHEIDESTTLLEAGLGWIVAWTKGEFVGREALERQKTTGTPTRLVGFEMVGRGIARHGHDVWIDGARAGRVTSGTQTPFLRKAIGMAYIPRDHAEIGREFDVDVRGQRCRARIVHMPFYSRPKG